MKLDNSPFELWQTYRTRGGRRATVVSLRLSHSTPILAVHHASSTDECDHYNMHDLSGRAWLSRDQDLIPPLLMEVGHQYKSQCGLLARLVYRHSTVHAGERRFLVVHFDQEPIAMWHDVNGNTVAPGFRLVSRVD